MHYTLYGYRIRGSESPTYRSQGTARLFNTQCNRSIESPADESV